MSNEMTANAPVNLSSEAEQMTVDHESKRKDFLEFYARSYPNLQSAEDALANLIRLLLLDLTIQQPKVGSRIKTRDECLTKFDLKYRTQAENSGKDYNIADFITDLVGLRVVCLYETDIVKVRDLLTANFDVIGTTDKTGILVEDVGRFGYKGFHLDIRLKQDRVGLPEYKHFADLRYEVQIRSIVQDAWSEVDHKLKYKRQIPDFLKRRIIRLAALFELADQEFASIRDETERLQENATASIAAPGSERLKLDAFSFLSRMKERHPTYPFDPTKVDGFVSEIQEAKKGFSLGEFDSILAEHGPLMREYRLEKEADGVTFNPFTELRHILYRSNQDEFRDMLYPKQKERLLEWFRNRSKLE